MKSLVFSLFALFFLANTAWADDISDALAACRGYPDIPVRVTPSFPTPAYDFNQGIGTLMAMSADTHHSIREGLSLGLTRYEPILEVRAPIVGIKLPNGGSCAHVEHVDVTLGYENVVVLVAHEIPQGTCGFNEVMAHEMRHIAANQQILQMYVPRIADELKAYLRVNGARQEASTDYAMNIVGQKLHDIVNPLLQEMSQENERLQQTIDTPQEYARITASCNGQLRAIASQFMYRR